MRFLSSKHGVTMLAITLSVIALSISVTIALPRADNLVTREKETELRFILNEFKTAVEKFEHNYDRMPSDIDELIYCQNNNRFLRNKYLDPFTGKFDWKIDKSSDTFIVYSASNQKSLSGITYSDFR